MIGKFKECRNFSYNSGKLITYRYTRGTNFSRRALIEGKIILWLRRNKFETWRTYHLIKGGCLIQFPLIQVWLYLYTAILQLDINQAFMKAPLAKVWQQTNIIIPPNNSEEHITKSFTKLELKLQTPKTVEKSTSLRCNSLMTHLICWAENFLGQSQSTVKQNTNEISDYFPIENVNLSYY